MDLQMIFPPLIGAGIGYITNAIAIRMLFRPRKALYIGKLRVPFTPGVIPKEKGRIAAAIGASVQSHLLNGEILADSLVSDEMLSTIRTRLTALVDDNRENTSTVEETILRYTSRENLERTTAGITQGVAAMVHKKLVELEFGEKIAVIALQGIRQKMEASRWSFMSSVLDDRMIGNMSPRMGEMINTAIAEHSQSALEEVIGNEIEKILEKRVCDMIEQYDEKLPDLLESLLRAYTNTISSYLAHVFDAINISKIIEERIVALDPRELEALIFSLMKRELRAIVYLGALLGFLMGFLNLAIGFL